MSRQTKEKYARYEQTPKGKYRAYKSRAKRRGIVFKLSLAEFSSFWKVPCHYCSYPIFTVGLDRIDNEGYEMGKIVSCCQPCNQAKSDLTQARFFELCRQVVKTHGLTP